MLICQLKYIKIIVGSFLQCQKQRGTDSRENIRSKYYFPTSLRYLCSQLPLGTSVIPSFFHGGVAGIYLGGGGKFAEMTIIILAAVVNLRYMCSP